MNRARARAQARAGQDKPDFAHAANPKIDLSEAEHCGIMRAISYPTAPSMTPRKFKPPHDSIDGLEENQQGPGSIRAKLQSASKEKLSGWLRVHLAIEGDGRRRNPS